MDLLELLAKIDIVAKENNISKPFIVGGVPRDKVLGRLNKMEDLDITTGDQTVLLLGKKLAEALSLSNHYKQFEDGHSQLLVGDLKLDFSSNFRVPGIKELLIKAGLKNPTEMQCEVFSRDFTCNSLLLSLDLKNIYDPTGLGIKDIKSHFLRTCLPASLTLGSQHKRIVRIIYIAAKLHFNVDPEIITWVKSNPETFTDAKPRYLTEKLNQAIKADLQQTVKLISNMGLWPYIPIIQELIPYINSFK